MKSPTLPIPAPSFYLLATGALLLLSGCASHSGAMKTAYHGSQVVASGPVAADDASMKQKPGTVKTKHLERTQTKQTEHDTEMSSTETTTVEGASAVAALDAEVKVNQ